MSENSMKRIWAERTHPGLGRDAVSTSFEIPTAQENAAASAPAGSAEIHAAHENMPTSASAWPGVGRADVSTPFEIPSAQENAPTSAPPGSGVAGVALGSAPRCGARAYDAEGLEKNLRALPVLGKTILEVEASVVALCREYNVNVIRASSKYCVGDGGERREKMIVLICEHGGPNRQEYYHRSKAANPDIHPRPNAKSKRVGCPFKININHSKRCENPSIGMAMNVTHNHEIIGVALTTKRRLNIPLDDSQKETAKKLAARGMKPAQILKVLDVLGDGKRPISLRAVRNAAMSVIGPKPKTAQDGGKTGGGETVQTQDVIDVGEPASPAGEASFAARFGGASSTRTGPGSLVSAGPSPTSCYALRLLPGQELKDSLVAFTRNAGLQASFVMSCVGSVRDVTVRLAGAERPSSSRTSRKRPRSRMAPTESQSGAKDTTTSHVEPGSSSSSSSSSSSPVCADDGDGAESHGAEGGRDGHEATADGEGKPEGDPMLHTSPEARYEVLSLVGTLSGDGAHLHVSLGDEDGAVCGGHLVRATVHTTAEVVLGEATALRFARAMDEETGFKELVVQDRGGTA